MLHSFSFLLHQLRMHSVHNYDTERRHRQLEQVCMWAHWSLNILAQNFNNVYKLIACLTLIYNLYSLSLPMQNHTGPILVVDGMHETT